jgi:tRNA(fMet)-specific endonuclease VapC
MEVMLDASVCVDILRGRGLRKLNDRLGPNWPGSTTISAVVCAELYAGAHSAVREAEERARVEAFLGALTSIPFDVEASRMAGRASARLRREGKSIGPLDELIAGHALARGAALLTANVREFRRVEGLRVESW